MTSDQGTNRKKISHRVYTKKVYYVKLTNKKTKEVDLFLFSSKKLNFCLMGAAFLMYHIGCLRSLFPSFFFKTQREANSIYVDTTIGLYPNIIDVPYLLEQLKK